MSTKRISVTLVALVLTTAASAAQAAPRRAYDSTPSAAWGYQGEAPPWSFACMKDHGPSDCREPMWIYGN
jgi:hypothetical protein